MLREEMIDYEKLKIAHELILKCHEKYGLACYVSCSHDAYLRLYAFNSDYFEDFRFSDIDDLINKLTKLTKLPPKYKDAWYINAKGLLACTKFHNREGYVFCDETAIEVTDCRRIYPSKEALIEAQIEYWSSLKDDIQINQNEVDIDRCQHEKDDHWAFDAYRYNDKCKKCGELYR